MSKAEWGDNPVCWWLGLCVCFVCCLDEASCTGCYWWLGAAGSRIQAASSVWVLTIWSSLGLVLWSSRVLESVLPLQRLRAWSLGSGHSWVTSQTWMKPFGLSLFYVAVGQFLQPDVLGTLLLSGKWGSRSHFILLPWQPLAWAPSAAPLCSCSPSAAHLS